MNDIALIRCEDYEIEKLRVAVRRAVDLIGGIASFIKPGDKVLLKVNLLMKRKPERVTTTHPAFPQVLAEMVIEAGGFPIIGDSPGGYHFYNRNVLESVYETCGMKEAAEKSGAELNYNTEVIDVPFHEGKKMKTIKTIRPVLEVDKIINIPKIKTHMMTVYSGAVKNMFGIIPGSYKAEYHLRFDDTADFADLLIDICQFSKPVLTVMDAVIGMEGYGPTAGKPKKVGLVIAGADPYVLDVVAASIIGLKSEQVPTIIKSRERGLCSGNLNDIKILGERVENVTVKNFQKPTVKISMNYYNIFLPKFLRKLLDSHIKPIPRFVHHKCTSCGVCEKSCPPHAISLKEGKPYVDLNKCIHCFCCHELCNHDAIKIKRPWFLRLLLR